MTTITLRRLCAAFLLALCLPGGAMAADPVPEAGNAAPVRVVIWEQLMEAPPAGLPVLTNAALQLEREFAPTSNEIQALVGQLNAAQAAIRQAEQAGRKDDAAIARAEQLSKDLERKSEAAGQAYKQRQAAVLGPLMEQIDLALERYAAATPGGDAFLLGRQEFEAEPAGQLRDISAEFVSWMSAQP